MHIYIYIERERERYYVCINICIYIYVCIYTHVLCIYIYIYTHTIYVHNRRNRNPRPDRPPCRSVRRSKSAVYSAMRSSREQLDFILFRVYNLEVITFNLEYMYVLMILLVVAHGSRIACRQLDPSAHLFEQIN